MVMQMETAQILNEFIATRSPELREKLVLQSVPLVHYLLSRMGFSQNTGSDYEDLAHQGLMGLIEAVDHFDPAYSTRFSTYASMRIRGKILDYLRTTDWMPRTARSRARLIDKTVTALWSKNLREPTDDEIAEHLNLNVEEIRQGLADSSRVLVSLDMMMEATEGQDGSLHEFISDENQANPSDILEEASLLDGMTDAIRNLPEREQLVLSLYYNDELTFREIGKVMNVTESRVCQLHARAIANLKAMMENEQ